MTFQISSASASERMPQGRNMSSPIIISYINHNHTLKIVSVCSICTVILVSSQWEWEFVESMQIMHFLLILKGSLDFLVDFGIFGLKISQRHCRFARQNRQNQLNNFAKQQRLYPSIRNMSQDSSLLPWQPYILIRDPGKMQLLFSDAKTIVFESAKMSIFRLHKCTWMTFWLIF